MSFMFFIIMCIFMTYINLFERDQLLEGVPTKANLIFGAIGMFLMLSLLMDFIVWIIY